MRLARYNDPVGEISERKDLLRILLADDDDANAFVFQCGINRLSRPCAFQRVGAHSFLPEKIQNFRPHILIAAGHFAQPGEFKQIKQLTNGHPVVCIVDSSAQGEACLDLGAADCLLSSQTDQIAPCVERHLNGPNTPLFKRSAERGKPAAKTSAPSRWELKLEEIDRRIGAFLKRCAKKSHVHWLAFVRRSQTGWSITRRELIRRSNQLKVQWLLQKQKRLLRSQSAARREDAQSDELHTPSPSRLVTPAAPPLELKQRKVFVMPPPPEASDYRDQQLPCKTPLGTDPGKPQGVPLIEAADSDTLRTLELSFKTLFHTGLDAMFLLDGLGSILHANAPGCTLLGLAPADLLGKSLLEFVPPDQKAQVSALWEALLIEGQQKAEIRLQTPAGEKRDVLLSARSNLWFGVHLLVVRDQTELKALRAASRSSADPMNAA